MPFDHLLCFNDLLLEYQRIERVVPVPGTARKENDVEHSYMLTMLAWYLIEKDKLDLDVAKALKYALVHDFVEVYAGDTYIYDEKAKATKKQREENAAKRLKKEHPDFHSMHEYIEAYEHQADPESRYVRALDKLIPILTIFSDERGKMWRQYKVTLAMLVEAKQSTIDKSPEVKKYFDPLVDYFKEHPEFFDREAVTA